MMIAVALIAILLIGLLAGTNLVVSQYNADELSNMGIETK
jgi:F0F1-type ATP synthase assembly protein I